MTCIVGLAHEGKVWIGGDSAGVAGMSTVARADGKVFTVGELVMGFTTSFRMGQLLRYSLLVEEQRPSQDDHEYLCTTFVDSVRLCLQTGGFARKQDEVEIGGTFLVGYRGSLYSIEDDYQVGQPQAPFHAVGCGDELALGAMHATDGQPPRERITTALKAAERFSGGVCAPFTVESA